MSIIDHVLEMRRSARPLDPTGMASNASTKPVAAASTSDPAVYLAMHEGASEESHRGRGQSDARRALVGACAAPRLDDDRRDQRRRRCRQDSDRNKLDASDRP